MANVYSYTGPGTRWEAGDPTAEDYLNVSRVNVDHVYAALNTIMSTAACDGILLPTGGLDLNGTALIIDADGDSKLQAAVDDTVVLTINNAEALRWTAAGEQIVNGRWIGLGAAAGRLTFADATPDTITVEDATFVAPTITATTINAASNTISSNATTLSFDGAAAIDTSGNAILTLNTGSAHLDVTTGLLDVTGAATISSTLTASSTLNVTTATNFQLGSVAYTGSMADLNNLRNDSMADALHRHSELSASDGTPNPALLVDASGAVFANAAAAVSIGSVTPLLQVHSTAAQARYGLSAVRWTADAEGSFLRVGKSRSATVGTPGVVTTLDVLGGLSAHADDGTDMDGTAASIQFAVTGTVTTDQTPGEIRFLTATNASPSVLTQRAVITNAGSMGIGTPAPEGTLHLYSTAAATALMLGEGTATNDHYAYFTMGHTGNGSLDIQVGKANVGWGTLGLNFAGGNVGVGTNAPVAGFHMAAADAAFTIAGEGNNRGFRIVPATYSGAAYIRSIQNTT